MLGLPQLIPEVLRLFHHPETRVAFLVAPFVLPDLVLAVLGVKPNQDGWILDVSLQDLPGVFQLGVQIPVGDESFRRDQEQDRLVLRRLGLLDGFPDHVRFHFVDLVQDPDVDVPAFFVPGPVRELLDGALVFQVVDPGEVLVGPLAFRVEALPHVVYFLEDDIGLGVVVAAANDIDPAAPAHEFCQGQGRAEGRLPVLPGDQEDDLLESPEAGVRPLEAVERFDERLLPQLQLER